MKTSTATIRLTQSVMIAATIAAAFMAQAADAASATAMPVLTFERVTVTGSRAALAPAIIQLPRVVVIGHRDAAAPVLARKDDSRATTVRPLLVASR